MKFKDWNKLGRSITRLCLLQADTFLFIKFFNYPNPEICKGVEAIS